jgi:four helix bundle protein
MNSKNDLIDLTFEFVLEIIEYTEKIYSGKRFVISNQLLKSGTSIGANSREAQSAESRTDFIHKLKIASKECEETDYWLQLCKFSKSYPDPDNLIEKNLRIRNLLSKIIATTRKRLKST